VQQGYFQKGSQGEQVQSPLHRSPQEGKEGKVQEVRKNRYQKQ